MILCCFLVNLNYITFSWKPFLSPLSSYYCSYPCLLYKQRNMMAAIVIVFLSKIRIHNVTSTTSEYYGDARHSTLHPHYLFVLCSKLTDFHVFYYELIIRKYFFVNYEIGPSTWHRKCTFQHFK